MELTTEKSFKKGDRFLDERYMRPANIITAWADILAGAVSGAVAIAIKKERDIFCKGVRPYPNPICRKH